MVEGKVKSEGTLVTGCIVRGDESSVRVTGWRDYMTLGRGRRLGGMELIGAEWCIFRARGANECLQP